MYSLYFIQALSDCVQDLLCPFQNETIDLVAGIDAMGFILGKDKYIKNTIYYLYWLVQCSHENVFPKHMLAKLSREPNTLRD